MSAEGECPYEAERELRDEPPTLAAGGAQTIVGDPRLDATDAEVRDAIEGVTEADRDE